MGYQSEAELEERLMQKLESQGYERIKLADYDALVERLPFWISQIIAERTSRFLQRSMKRSTGSSHR